MAIIKEPSHDHSDRSLYDRKRHRQILDEAIKKNLGDIIAEENIIGQSKQKKYKIPVKGIKEYQFIYGKGDGVAAGTGSEERGQVIGKTGDNNTQGQGQAGNDPGEEIYETEITMDEIINYLFEDLKLPDMDRKKYGLVEQSYRIKRLGYQTKGIPPRLAKKKSVVEKLKRKQALIRNVEPGEQLPERIPFREEDLRYFRIRQEVKHCANAVVICIMDTSGSMDQTKKYLARSFYFLLYQFLRWQYEQVAVVFIAHTTEAKEVSEWEFFHRAETGGTSISSGYLLALDIIKERYNPDNWNIYAFHCSDGDNWSDDNAKAIAAAKQLCEVCNLFGYCEITFSSTWNMTIRRELERHIKHDNFVIAVIVKQEDVWPAFKNILDKKFMVGEE